MAISHYLKQLRGRIGTVLVIMPAVVGLMRNEAGLVLFQRSADSGDWGLPGGSVDPGESPAVALVREVLEETGLHVRPERVAGVFGGPGYRVRYANGDIVEYTVIVFECRILGGELGGLDDETAELRYFSAGARPVLDAPFPDELFDAPGSRPALFI